MQIKSIGRMFAQSIWLSTGGQKLEPKSAEEHDADGVEDELEFTDRGCGHYAVQIQIGVSNEMG